MTDPQTQNELVTWTDNAGNVTPLAWLYAQNDPQVIWGRKGAYMPTPLFAKYVSPAQDGAIVKFLRWQERELDLTVELFCDDIIILKQRMGALTQALSPAKGIGKLSFTHETGTTRYLNCNLLKGMEGVEPQEYGLGFVGRMVLVFESPDVYFNDPLSPTAQTISVTAGAGNTNGGGPHTYTNSATLTNVGTAPAWPVWTITCPHSITYVGSISTAQTYIISVIVTNDTTGNYFIVNFTSSGITIVTHSTVTSTDTTRVVDTRTGIKSVKNGSGTLVMSELQFTNLFPLASGNNAIRVDVIVPENNAGNNFTYAAGTTVASMTYQPADLAIT